MNTQLKKLGLGLLIAVLPMMASIASAQWTQQGQTGVRVNFGDSSAQATTAPMIHIGSNQTVALDQNGSMFGQIVNGQEGMNVFIVRNDQVIKQAKTQSDGSFAIQGLNEGAYSFFAAGQSGFAAYGVYVTKQSGGSGQNMLNVALASPRYNGIQQLVESNVPAEVRASIANATGNPTTQGVKQVRLINGRLSGKIDSLYGQRQLSPGIQVQLIQYDKPIAQVQTDAQGQFSIPDVAPGVYDFVAASQNGFTVGRFEAVGNRKPTTQVSFRKTATQLDGCLTCPSETAQPIDYAIEPSYTQPVEYAGESVIYGGASGGSAGGAGNYSSYGGQGVVRGRFGGRGARLGGRGGRVLWLGAITAGIIAVSDDNNPPPASPITP